MWVLDKMLILEQSDPRPNLTEVTSTQSWINSDTWVNAIQKQKQTRAMPLKARETLELSDLRKRQEGTLYSLRCSHRSMAH